MAETSMEGAFEDWSRTHAMFGRAASYRMCFAAAWEARGSDLKEVCELLGQFQKNPAIFVLFPEGNGGIQCNGKVVGQFNAPADAIPAIRAALPEPPPEPTARETFAAWCRLADETDTPDDSETIDRFLMAAAEKEGKDAS